MTLKSPLKTNCFEDQEKFTWRLKPFLMCYPVALLLGLSFFIPGGEMFWRPADEAFFRLLNDTLSLHSFWATLVAWSNTRLFDTLWGSLMGVLCLWVLLVPRYGPLTERFARVFAAAFAVIGSIALTKFLFREYDRLSPSRVLDEIIHLGDLLPHISAKIGSSNSFPGDHGVASVMLVLCFFLFFRPWPHLTLIALPIALLNSLPRLIAGGHWLSDVIVGAGAVGLITYPMLTGTPYFRRVLQLSTPLVAYILQPVLRKIGLSRLAR